MLISILRQFLFAFCGIALTAVQSVIKYLYKQKAGRKGQHKQKRPKMKVRSEASVAC